MVMKVELGWIPLYGWFSHKFQHIFVKRDKGPSALKGSSATRVIAPARARDRDLPGGHAPAARCAARLQAGIRGRLRGVGPALRAVAVNSGLFWPRRSVVRYPAPS